MFVFIYLKSKYQQNINTMYHNLIVFLNPKENYQVLGYQSFLSDSSLNQRDVNSSKKKLEINVTGYTPDSTSESKYARFGTLIYDKTNNVLTIKFSDEMDDVVETAVEVTFVSKSSEIQIDLEISRILCEKRGDIFQVVGLFNEDHNFSVIGYVTFFGCGLENPETDVEYTGKEWIISLDKYREDTSQYQSEYQRLCCHYDQEEKKLHIELPDTMGDTSCQIYGYYSPIEDIDKVLQEMREKCLKSIIDIDMLAILLSMIWSNKAPSFSWCLIAILLLIYIYYINKQNYNYSSIIYYLAFLK